MVNLLYVEFKKLRRLYLWVIILVGAFVPSFFIFNVYFIQNRQPLINWSELMFSVGNNSALFEPAIFAIIIGYSLAREYEQHTFDYMLTYPYSRYKFILCKMIYMIPISLLTLVLTIFCALASGVILLGSMPSFYLIVAVVKINLYVNLAQIALIPLAVAVCLIGRSYIIAASYSMSLLLCTIMMTRFKFYYVIPWLIPWAIGKRMGYLPLDIIPYQYDITCIILCITFVVSLVFSIMYIKNFNTGMK